MFYYIPMIMRVNELRNANTLALNNKACNFTSWPGEKSCCKNITLSNSSQFYITITPTQRNTTTST